MSTRDILQLVGTDVMRDFYPDVWSRAAVVSCLRQPGVSIITDARFPNELDIFDSFKDKIKLISIRVSRDGTQADSHESENAMDNYPVEKYTYLFDNSGTLDDMKEFAKGVVLWHFRPI